MHGHCENICRFVRVKETKYLKIFVMKAKLKHKTEIKSFSPAESHDK